MGDIRVNALGYAIAGLVVVCLVLLVMAVVVARSLNRIESRQEMPEKTHLPSLCKPYYNDGTDAWAECMGVGRK